MSYKGPKKGENPRSASKKTGFRSIAKLWESLKKAVFDFWTRVQKAFNRKPKQAQVDTVGQPNPNASSSGSSQTPSTTASGGAQSAAEKRVAQAREAQRAAIEAEVTKEREEQGTQAHFSSVSISWEVDKRMRMVTSKALSSLEPVARTATELQPVGRIKGDDTDAQSDACRSLDILSNLPDPSSTLRKR